MTRDYKHTTTRKRDNGPPGWLWFTAGLTVGLAVAAIVYLSDNAQRGYPPAAEVQMQDARGVAKSDAENPPPPRRRYDFYTLLPELEVVVPEAEVPAPEAAETPATPPTEEAPKPSDPGVGYILQAGSFKKMEQADRLKANIALLGIEADIQSVSVDNDTWHRVRIGPYPDMAEVGRIRERLNQSRIETLLLKVRE